MKAVLRKALADARRRRLQTGVLGLVALLSATAATLALALLIETDAPYDHAFDQAAGPHLVVTFDAARTPEPAAAATGLTSGVTGAIGPLPSTPTDMEFTRQHGGEGPAALDLTVTLVGRDRPDLAVDRLTLTSGAWAHSTREVVLATGLAKATGSRVGDTVAFPQAAGAPVLTVSGIASSISTLAGAWALPDAVPALASHAKAGTPSHLSWVMEYRLASANDPAAVSRTLTAIGAEAPPGAVTSSVSWLDAKKAADLTAAVMVPFLVAFSALGLLAAAFVISNAVAGVVVADGRAMAVMRSIGFTPAQVTGVLVLQVLLPVVAGGLVGVPLGTAASQPFLQQTAEALGLPSVFADTALAGAGVLALLLAVAAAAAAAPAVRAGRASATAAFSAAVGPSSARGARAATGLGRLPLGPSVRLGLADLAGRPLRTVMSGAAVLLGVATVCFSLALSLSLSDVAAALVRDQAVQVDVGVAPDRQVPNVAGLVRSTPGTERFVGEGTGQVTVPGAPGTVTFTGYDGDSSWIGFTMISGRWFAAPGEVVAPSHLLDVAGLRLGQTFTATAGDRQVRLRLVGEIFDQSGDDLLLRGSWADLKRLDPSATIGQYEVRLARGTDARQYASDLERAGGGSLDVRPVDQFSAAAAFVLIETVLGGLAVVLTGIAGAGVLNTVVLRTRERRREIAVLRALGMDTGQVVAMVVAPVAIAGLAAGALGVPLGLVLHHRILVSMAEIAINTRVPASFFSVLGPLSLAGLVAAGAIIAAAGAWLPARWAAGEPVPIALHAE